MSQLKVNNITNEFDNGPVTFDKGIIADGSQLTLKPSTLSFDPQPLSVNISAASSITIGFNQNMQFLGTGDIRIREGSASGTITTSFTTGVSTEISIVGGVLTINPKNNLAFGQTYFVTLPSVGIANTLGAYITELNTYQFQTEFNPFNIEGGDFSQVIVDSNSPTGYYKYNVFTSSGIATLSAPSSNAEDFAYVLVAGGGGGGSSVASVGAPAGGGGGAGGYVKNYNSTNLPLGNYTVTIGSGGSGTWNWPSGVDNAPPTTPNNGTSPSPAPYTVVPSPGGESTFGPTPVGTIIAYGGGCGGHGAIRGNQPPSPGSPPSNPYRLYWNSPGNSSTHPAPSNPSYTFVPIPNSPNGNPISFSRPDINNPCGGRPGGSGGGHSSMGDPPGYYPTVGNTRLTYSGSTGTSYPSPNQQGYPGGPFYLDGSPPASQPGRCRGSGGGGAGGSGGPGGSPSYGPGGGPWPSATGGSGKQTPEFPGPGLALISGMPSPFTDTLGPTGYLAGGGGGSLYDTGTNPTNPNLYVPRGTGGNGGGGDGYTGAPSPHGGTSYSEEGITNSGGGGGAGISGPNPNAPAPGKWLGRNGGSGVMMFRYAHPGS